MTQNYEALGWKLKRKGEYKEAIIAFDKGIELRQKVYFALHGKGECLLGLNKPDDALACFLQAIKLDSTHSWAYHGAARAYFCKKEYEAALAFSTKSSELDSTSTYAWIWKGKSLIKLGQIEKAIETLKKALKCATVNRQDMASEIDKLLSQITTHRDTLQDEINRLSEENEKLRNELKRLSSGKFIIQGNINGNVVENGGIVVQDDAVINRSVLGGNNADEN